MVRCTAGLRCCGYARAVSIVGGTAQDRFRSMVRTELAPELRRLGFRGSGAQFELPSATHWLLLGLQRSTSSTADEVRFTVNLSAVDRQAWDTKRETEKWMGVRPSANVLGPVTASKRLGILVWGTDTWFTVQPNRSTKDVARGSWTPLETRASPGYGPRSLPMSPARKPLHHCATFVCVSRTSYETGNRCQATTRIHGLIRSPIQRRVPRRSPWHGIRTN
jgi:hypothetical protein